MMSSSDSGKADDAALLAAAQREGRFSVRLLEPRLFLQKLAVIVLASFAFLPLMAAHEAGHVSALVYAAVLIVLHVSFIIIYLWRVRYRELDGGDCRSLSARVIGLVACVMLLWLVAKVMTGYEVSLWMLALEILGLCAVHTLILALLMVRVRIGAQLQESAQGSEQRREPSAIVPGSGA